MFQPHEQRVIDEHADLDDKLKKLSAFIKVSPIYASLDEDEQGRLRIQQAAMTAYSEVLEQRIRHFRGR